MNGIELAGARRALVAGALAVALAGLGACGGSREPTTTTARVEAPKRDRWTHARGLFNEMCAGCHALADAGAGARGGRSNLDELVIGRIEPRARESVARAAMSEDPVKGLGFMPRWKGVLTDQDFDALVDYLVAVAGNDRS